MSARGRQDVLEFYRKLPFNANENPETAAKMIKAVNSVEYIYPESKDLYSAQSVLEIGCGAKLAE